MPLPFCQRSLLIAHNRKYQHKTHIFYKNYLHFTFKLIELLTPSPSEL